MKIITYFQKMNSHSYLFGINVVDTMYIEL
jgi:hypothetical protein